MSTAQYDVVDNPVPRARKAFPFVAILQSDLADTGSDRIVAPLVPSAHIPGVVGRLMPIVTVAGVDCVLIVPRLMAVPAAELRTVRDSLSAYRNEIVAALDLLFLGV
ncbi:MAG: plasmid maintenance protein CcdB [Proteobacteria bacterium]|nr:plasmid maintenance protein CcdB [Pseudomonadota bacterium]